MRKRCWGQYVRERSETLLTSKGTPKMLWRRKARGGKAEQNSLREGPLRAWVGRFVCLRHRVASLLFEEKMHPKVVQEILGHSNISITLDVYSHMLPTMESDAPGRLDDLLKE